MTETRSGAVAPMKEVSADSVAFNNEAPIHTAPPVAVFPAHQAPGLVALAASVRTVAAPVTRHSTAAPAKRRLSPGVTISTSRPAPKPSNQLVTISGTAYNNYYVERVNRDGLVISYTLNGGGFGMATISASDLPSEMRDKYNFRPQNQ
jgi:hypothetical protein